MIVVKKRRKYSPFSLQAVGGKLRAGTRKKQRCDINLGNFDFKQMMTIGILFVIMPLKFLFDWRRQIAQHQSVSVTADPLSLFWFPLLEQKLFAPNRQSFLGH